MTTEFEYQGIPMRIGQDRVAIPPRPGWKIAWTERRPFGLVICWRKEQ